MICSNGLSRAFKSANSGQLCFSLWHTGWEREPVHRNGLPEAAVSQRDCAPPVLQSYNNGKSFSSTRWNYLSKALDPSGSPWIPRLQPSAVKSSIFSTVPCRMNSKTLRHNTTAIQSTFIVPLEWRRTCVRSKIANSFMIALSERRRTIFLSKRHRTGWPLWLQILESMPHLEKEPLRAHGKRKNESQNSRTGNSDPLYGFKVVRLANDLKSEIRQHGRRQNNSLLTAIIAEPLHGNRYLMRTTPGRETATCSRVCHSGNFRRHTIWTPRSRLPLRSQRQKFLRNGSTSKCQFKTVLTSTCSVKPLTSFGGETRIKRRLTYSHYPKKRTYSIRNAIYRIQEMEPQCGQTVASNSFTPWR